MKRFWVLLLLCFLLGIAIGEFFIVPAISPQNPQPTITKPSDLLRFQPVCEGSDPNLVRIAQAELCRHGIECKIDSEFGKQTAFGQCKLFVMIQKGYKVKTIYEKR